MKRSYAVSLVVATILACLFLFRIEAASVLDPGVRGGTPAAGGPLRGLTAGQLALFKLSKTEFQSVEAVADGLGPTMNLNSCVGCHLQPAAGGSSPPINPQVAFATLNGADNVVPSYISLKGPVREARFVTNPDGTPDGGVHALFTIQGRKDAPRNCVLAQPDFETAVNNNNVIFRIPTPTFGAGLIEQIPDTVILNNHASDSTTKRRLGIRGRPNIVLSGSAVSGQANHNGNDGTIARFGWKAQNKSLLLFAGEAYNVEMGITNDLFQTERNEDVDCNSVGTPNDATTTNTLSAIEQFAVFMRFLAPPTPNPSFPGGSKSISNGSSVFSAIGCNQCHTPTLQTGKSTVAALSNQQVNLYSDLLTHDMGTGLADGISQGQAGPREFRTAPLWGLGQRIFFLHDGRTSDLLVAIAQHSSSGSEATTVISNFNALSDSNKQDLLNFLRSL